MTQLAEALAHAELAILGRLPEASNVALLAQVAIGDAVVRCIYKPVRGERPLWDFPGAALAAREVLTAEVAGCFGWDLVPATVWRDEGPLGPGMCQEWIESDAAPPVGLFPPGEVPAGWCEVAEGRTGHGTVVVLAHDDSPILQRLAVLDALVNNADRKGGHVLARPEGGIAAIDHGVTFHAEPKLRTVLWGWAGQAVPQWLLAEVRAGARTYDELLSPSAGAPLVAAHLTSAETTAARSRLADLLVEATFPLPGDQWPALPWPPM